MHKYDPKKPETERQKAKKRGDLHKVQTLFRLWNDDRDKLILKMQMDDTTLQRMLEALIKEYLADNPAIMAIVNEKAKANGKRGIMTRDSYFNNEETESLLERISMECPLQDKAIIPK